MSKIYFYNQNRHKLDIVQYNEKYYVIDRLVKEYLVQAREYDMLTICTDNNNGEIDFDLKDLLNSTSSQVTVQNGTDSIYIDGIDISVLDYFEPECIFEKHRIAIGRKDVERMFSCLKLFLVEVIEGYPTYVAVGRGARVETFYDGEYWNTCVRTSSISGYERYKVRDLRENYELILGKLLLIEQNMSLIVRLPTDIMSDLVQTPQHLLYHPEGSVYNHTILTCWMAAHNANIAIAALFHDLGKIHTTAFDLVKNRYTANGHDMYCKYFIDKYMDRFDDIYFDEEQVRYVCAQHMRIAKYQEMRKFKRQELRNSKYFLHVRNFHRYDGIQLNEQTI